MIVVADSSSIVALSLCNCLNILEVLFGEVKVSKSVFEEVTVAGKPGSDDLRKFLEGKSIAPNMVEFTIEGGSLDYGELSSIALYKQLNADYLLIDEKAGRRVAKLNNIKIIGSLGVLVQAKKKRLLPSIKLQIETLASSKIYFSSALLKEALKIADEDQDSVN